MCVSWFVNIPYYFIHVSWFVNTPWYFIHVSWFVNNPLLFHACQLICEHPWYVIHVSWFVNSPLLFHACQLICEQLLTISCMAADLWTVPYYFMHDSWFVNRPLLFHACQLICVHPLTISCMSANLWTPQNTPFMHTIWATSLLLPDASQNLDTRFYLGTFEQPIHLPLVCPSFCSGENVRAGMCSPTTVLEAIIIKNDKL